MGGLLYKAILGEEQIKMKNKDKIQPRVSEIETRNLVACRFILAINIESYSEVQSPEIL